MTNSIAVMKRERDAKIAKAEKAVDHLTPVQRMATEVHNAHCKLDHTDHCDWGYGNIVKNPLTSHKEYIKKAEELIDKGYDIDQVSDILVIVRGG